MTGKYDDIINLPHHQSFKHAHMSAHARAAQFAPFAALTGFDDDIEEATEDKLDRFDEKGRKKAEVEQWIEPS